MSNGPRETLPVAHSKMYAFQKSVRNGINKGREQSDDMVLSKESGPGGGDFQVARVADTSGLAEVGAYEISWRDRSEQTNYRPVIPPSLLLPTLLERWSAVILLFC